MIRAPAAYDPFRHPRAARARRASVLARMERNGHLRRAVRAQGRRRPPGPAPGRPGHRRPRPEDRRGRRPGANPAATQRAPWFVGLGARPAAGSGGPALRRAWDLAEGADGRVFTGGLRITTTVDLEAQAAAERAVAAVAGRRGRDPYGALVAVEPGTGAVRAMVGGRSWWDDARFGRVNLATGAGGGGRPAGSAFKTFALVAALERGIPPEAVFAAPDRLVVGRAGGTARRGGWPTTRAMASARRPCGRRPPFRSTPSTPGCCCGWAVATPTVAPGRWSRRPPGWGWTARCGRCRARSLGPARSRRWRWRPPTRPWPPRGGGRRRSGWPGSPGPTGGCCTRPGPVPTRSSSPAWPRSPPTCSGGWSTGAPGSTAGSGGRRPPRRARPRTTPTPGSWGSPRRWPRPCGSATPRAMCRWCRRGSGAGCRAGPGRRPSGPGSCGPPWPGSRTGGSPSPTPA